MIDTYLFNIPGAKYSPLKGTNITPPLMENFVCVQI